MVRCRNGMPQAEAHTRLLLLPQSSDKVARQYYLRFNEGNVQAAAQIGKSLEI